MDSAAEQATARQEAGPGLDSVVRLSRAAAIAELGQRALLSRDVEGLMELAVQLLRDVLGVEYVKVLGQPGPNEALVLVAGTGWSETVRPGHTVVPSDSGSQAGFTLLSSEPVLVEDLAVETRFSSSPILADHDVVSGASVIIQGRDRPYGVLGAHSTHRRRFTEDDGDFLRSVANLLGSALENRRIVEQAEKSARYETALSECAQALLASSGADRIESALQALFVATEATYVFLERNVVDPELGFCSKFVAEAEDPGAPGYEQETEFWDIVPWANMPTTRARLEKGLPIVIIPEELEGPEYDQYVADPYPVKSELEVPIFVNGEWSGLIGFSDQREVRKWTETDVSLLTTAATLIGAFWEREESQEKLRQLNRAKDEFLASVSHELRTPLTAVVGFGRVLQDSYETMSDGERAELLDMMVNQGDDLTNIISDLLVAARANIGRLNVDCVPVNLHAQITQVLDGLRQSDVVGLELLGPATRAFGDADRIRQILRNLISNAVRYGGERIRLQLGCEGHVVKVLVCDDGPPIPDEDRERIFEPYRRAHNAPGLVDSLGLGLSISRRLAELMGGGLTYRHENGESIFELELPLAD